MRHLVWASALVALFVLPLAAFVGPVWRLEILPAAAARSAPPALTFRPASVVESPVEGLASSDVGWDVRPAVGEGPAAVLVAPSPSRWRWSAAAVIVWMIGVLAGLLRLSAGLAWAAWIRRCARRDAGLVPESGWARDVEEASAVLGLTRRVSVYLTGRVGVPVATGIMRPTLLLPPGAEAWPGPRRRAVVLHELSHVVRRDCLVQAIGHAARSLHWFNPLASLALRRLRREQELACDDLVLSVGVPAVDYARDLCDVAGVMRSMRSPEWATLAMARPSNLEARLVSILDDRVSRRSPRGACRVAVSFVLAGVLPLGAMRLSALTTPALPGAGRAVPPSMRMPEMPDAAVTNALRKPRAGAVDVARVIPDAAAAPLDELRPVPDFSGTWILDAERSGSPTARPADSPRVPQWGDVVIIRQADEWMRIESRRGEQNAAVSYALDDRDYRYVEERNAVGGGVALRGSDVKTVWDGGKLVTLTRPFSLWVPDEREMVDAPNTSSMEFVSVRSLSADGQEMIVERVSRHDWGWGFDGRQPSAAYARVTDVYRRATP